jgi:hypothetical protein
MQNFEGIIEQIELNYNLRHVTKFSISYVDHSFFKYVLPKKYYRKYFLVIYFANAIIEKKTIRFGQKDDYKRAIFRLNYLLDTKYRK